MFDNVLKRPLRCVLRKCCSFVGKINTNQDIILDKFHVQDVTNTCELKIPKDDR